MEYTKEITVDLSGEMHFEYITAVQGDTARKIRITLLADNEPYQIPKDSTAVFRAKKPDNTNILNDCTIEDDSTVVADLTAQTLAVCGNVRCQITLYGADESILTSVPFTVKVISKNPEDSEIESTNEFNAIKDAAEIAEFAHKMATEALEAEAGVMKKNCGTYKWYVNSEANPQIDQVYKLTEGDWTPTGKTLKQFENDKYIGVWFYVGDGNSNAGMTRYNLIDGQANTGYQIDGADGYLNCRDYVIWLGRWVRFNVYEAKTSTVKNSDGKYSSKSGACGLMSSTDKAYLTDLINAYWNKEKLPIYMTPDPPEGWQCDWLRDTGWYLGGIKKECGGHPPVPNNNHTSWAILVLNGMATDADSLNHNHRLQIAFDVMNSRIYMRRGWMSANTWADKWEDVGKIADGSVTESMLSEDLKHKLDELKSALDMVGTLANLNTTAKKNVVEAINEIKAEVSNSAIKCTAEGRDISIQDASAAPLSEMRVYGKTVQNTTTGKNLYNGGDVECVENKGVRISIPEGTYTISAIVESSDTDANDCLILIYNLEGKQIASKLLVRSTNRTSAIFTVPEGKEANKITFYASNNYSFSVGDTATFKDIQIEAGTVATPYEPYTGGIPSPSPEYPQQLMSVGDKGNVNVVVRGKNLFDVEKAKDSANWVKPATQNGYYDFAVHIGKGNSFTVSYQANLTTGLPFYAGIALPNNDYMYKWLYHKSVANFTNVVSGKATEDNIYIRGSGLSHLISNLVKLQVEINTEPTTYEPYTAQTLTISTPNGLPGIPVSSGGNYTDENGQRWVCDTLEIRSDGTGKRVQRIGMVDNTKWTLSNILSETTGTRFMVVPNGAQAMQALGNTPVICSHYKQNTATSYSAEGDYISTNEAHKDGRIHIRTTRENTTAEEFVAWAEESGMKTFYILATPIETDLSAEEIAAYNALHTNRTTTNITNDEGAHMAVEYTADTKTYIDNKYAELQNAILSIGGNV